MNLIRGRLFQALYAGRKLVCSGASTADFIGAPGATRTHGTQIRNLVLYPPELRGHGYILITTEGIVK